MEEVDKIILLNLRQLGGDLADDVTSVGELGTEGFVEGCARCINAINQDDALPLSLPPGMSARFKVGTEIANACQALGYSSSIGYNTFLYGSETDSRNLLMWLVERLPQDAVQGSDDITGQGAFARVAARAVQARLARPYLPVGMYRRGLAWSTGPRKFQLLSQQHVKAFTTVILETPEQQPSKARLAYEATALQLTTAQPLRASAKLTSIMARNAVQVAQQAAWQAEWQAEGVGSGLDEAAYKHNKRNVVKEMVAAKLRAALSTASARKQEDMGEFLAQFANIELGKKSMFRKKEQLQFQSDQSSAEAPKAATQEELEQQRADELSRLQTDFDALSSELQQVETETLTYRKEAKQLAAKTEALLLRLEALDASNAMRRRVVDLLPNADENMQKLGEAIHAAARKMIAVGEKWEPVRQALLTEYRQLQAAAEDEAGATQQQLVAIQAIKQEIKGLEGSVHDKQQLEQQLQAEVDGMKQAAPRTTYVERIMDIIKSITKQQREIEKSLIDIRAVQKDLSQITEKLGRTYAFTDELVYKNAKKDEDVRQAYKYVATLHTTCEELVRFVEQIGAMRRETSALEDQIKTEQRKQMTSSVERITRDRELVKQENAKLKALLKQ